MWWLMNNNIKKKGFTLTELIVVIAIIGILAAVLIPSVVVYIKKARISNDTSDVKNMNTLLNAYVAENDVDLSKLEASDVYAIVNSSDSNYTFEPNYKKGVFYYSVKTKKIEYSSDGITAMSDGAGTDYSSVEDIYGNGNLYLNSTGDLANFLYRLRNVTNIAEYERLLAESTSRNLTKEVGNEIALKELVEHYDPKTTLYIGNSHGFTTVEQPKVNPSKYVKLDLSSTEVVLVDSVIGLGSLAMNGIVDLTAYKESYGVTSLTEIVYIATKGTDKYLCLGADEKVLKTTSVASYPKIENVVFATGLKMIPAMQGLKPFEVVGNIVLPITVGYVDEGAFVRVVSKTKLIANSDSVCVAREGLGENMTTNAKVVSAGAVLEKLETNNQKVVVKIGEEVCTGEQTGKLYRINALDTTINNVIIDTSLFTEANPNVENIKIEYTPNIHRYKDNGVEVIENSCDITITAFDNTGIILYIVISSKQA